MGSACSGKQSLLARGGCAAAVGADRRRGPSPRDCPACPHAGAAGTPYTPHPAGPQRIWAASGRFPVASVEGAWALSPALHARQSSPRLVSACCPRMTSSHCTWVQLARGRLCGSKGGFLPTPPCASWGIGLSLPLMDGVKRATPGSGKAGRQLEEPALLLIMITDAPFSCFLLS